MLYLNKWVVIWKLSLCLLFFIQIGRRATSQVEEDTFQYTPARTPATSYTLEIRSRGSIFTKYHKAPHYKQWALWYILRNQLTNNLTWWFCNKINLHFCPLAYVLHFDFSSKQSASVLRNCMKVTVVLVKQFPSWIILKYSNADFCSNVKDGCSKFPKAKIKNKIFNKVPYFTILFLNSLIYDIFICLFVFLYNKIHIVKLIK